VLKNLHGVGDDGERGGDQSMVKVGWREREMNVLTIKYRK
jgi:hypothetical protein